MPELKCITCGKEYPEEIRYTCDCGGLLEVKYDLDKLNFDLNEARKRPIGVWRYKKLLPANKNVSLQEGGTPLYECRTLGKELNIKLFVKNEGGNPTGSFKDRGMTVGVSKAIDFGSKIAACASTGNTSASLAAYSARAGLKCIVLIPGGKIAYGKLAQALIHGAMVTAISGSFDDAMSMVMEMCDKYKIYLLNSINPYRLEGQKTLGYEIYDQLDRIPDRIILPVGNAGNISAIWKGLTEFHELGIIDKFPKMCGIQAEGSKPVTDMFKKHLHELVPEKHPETIATAIRIGNPISWQKAIKAIYDSKGLADSVTDSEILAAQKLLSRKEGIFVEPASAASIAGLIKLVNRGEIREGEEIVCVTTGHGLKDPNTAIESCKNDLIEVKNIEELYRVISTI